MSQFIFSLFYFGLIHPPLGQEVILRIFLACEAAVLILTLRQSHNSTCCLYEAVKLSAVYSALGATCQIKVSVLVQCPFTTRSLPFLFQYYSFIKFYSQYSESKDKSSNGGMLSGILTVSLGMSNSKVSIIFTLVF